MTNKDWFKPSRRVGVYQGQSAFSAGGLFIEGPGS